MTWILGINPVAGRDFSNHGGTYINRKGKKGVSCNKSVKYWQFLPLNIDKKVSICVYLNQTTPKKQELM
jgi:hypothetical protein